MPAGGARHGRRDNGLTAAEYAAVGDVDPRVGEHLLDVLAVEGIAAYLQPAADHNPVTRATVLPKRPTDRLFADREHLQTARELLARLAAEESKRSAGAAEPLDIDAAWAGIVAGFDATAQRDAPPWPAAENLDPARAGDPDAPTSDPDLRARGKDEPDPTEAASLLDALDLFGADLPDDEDGYRRPPPPPLPRPSAQAALGVLGIAAGLAVLFVPGLLPIGSDLAVFAGLAVLLAGAAALVSRLRPGDDEDEEDDPDDGAVV